MSLGQARRDEVQDQWPEAITFGDIFNVNGSLAAQAITPQDAALMQSAETSAFGKTLKEGAAAAVMQAAAETNEWAGLVDSRAEDSVVGEQGVAVAEAHLLGMNVTMEYVAGQAIRSAICPALADYPTAAATMDVTIGEELETAAMTAGDKPVEISDAVAVQAAERQATGTGEISKGGVASAAQSAALLHENDLGRLSFYCYRRPAGGEGCDSGGREEDQRTGSESLRDWGSLSWRRR